MKKYFSLLLALLILFAAALPVCADIGPKDKLTVIVNNPPQEKYYLDLLTQDASAYSNLTEEERAALDPQMVELLYSCREEGWLPALVEGTGVPMWGDLVGTPDGVQYRHVFGYVGLPQTCRIILVTESGKVVTSEAFTRSTLQSSVAINAETGSITTPMPAVAYLLQFLSTCLPTLLIEGLLLLLFGFSLRENWKTVLWVNLLTQLVLAFIAGAALLKQGTIAATLVQIPTEIGILIFESIVYCRLLKGHSKGRRILYGVTANLVTWILGALLLGKQFSWLCTLL